MKKTLLATMLLLGTSIPLQNKSLEPLIVETKLNFSQNVLPIFLKTEQNSYHPKMEEFLKLKDIDYTKEKISESNPTKISEFPKYIPESELDNLINKLYLQQKVPEIISKEFFKTIIKKESHDGYGYNIYAHNKKSGARGLGQIMPETWRELDPNSNFYIEAINPERNLKNSLNYLKWLSKALQVKNPNWEKISNGEKLEQIIASYNWGIGRLEKNKWDFAKTPEETKDYKKFIENNSNVFEEKI